MFPVLRATTFLGLLAVGVPAFAYGQATVPAAIPQVKQTDNPAAGQNASGTEASHYDAQHRPITAGGFVKTGPIVFQDVSEKAGLTHWTHKMGTPGKSYLIETKGSTLR